MKKTLLAFLRLSNKSICEVSSSMGPYDFHDYPDDVEGTPFHFIELICKRC